MDGRKNRTSTDLIRYMHNLGIEFYGAADWGNTDETSIGVFAKIAGGMTWLLDMISAPDMEIPEIKEIDLDKYRKGSTTTWKIMVA